MMDSSKPVAFFFKISGQVSVPPLDPDLDPPYSSALCPSSHPIYVYNLRSVLSFPAAVLDVGKMLSIVEVSRASWKPCGNTIGWHIMELLSAKSGWIDFSFSSSFVLYNKTSRPLFTVGLGWRRTEQWYRAVEPPPPYNTLKPPALSYTTTEWFKITICKWASPCHSLLW